ncbi:MAG: N-acetylglucosamine-6-phosphate deacetylase [Clostridia bacterium]|nr:N-acetylglucosamine-6-phosphate deacetylase [Clostridia bacterium]
MIKIKSDKIIANGAIFDGFVAVDGGKITSVTKKDFPAEESYDFTGKYVSPGFIDIHTHGAGGYPFLDGTADDVINGSNFMLAHGTTTVLPTISAAPFERMKKAVINIKSAMESDKTLSNIVGAHLEGPYLSAAQCGAQCTDFITPPNASDYTSLVCDYGKYIARWTYAPENDECGSFCKYITSQNIIASAGHTNAKYEDMLTAMKNGCNLVTHLYSCTSTVTRSGGFRSLGVIETAFLSDDLYVEIIADGKHLPPELIKMIVKIKGADRVALITDSLEIAGTDIKSGVMGGTKFIVEDGVCKLYDRTAFAGSVALTDRIVRIVTEDCGFDLPTAIKMMCETPAKILGLQKGALRDGYDADVVVFDEKINISSVFVGGRKVI